MIRVCDVMSAKCVFSWNAKQARVPHHARAYITLQYTMIVTFGLIEVISQLVSLVKHFFINYTWNAFKMKIAVINDNNNFATSLFRSFCEFDGDCFGSQYFSLGALGPKQSPSISHNDLKKYVVQLLLSKYRCGYCKLATHWEYHWEYYKGLCSYCMHC